MNLRGEAKGRICMVRLPGTCVSGTDTTVLAHVRLAGITGVGVKSPDLLGAWACAACHLVTEREKGDDWVQRCFLEGVMRTQNVLIAEGKLKW